MPAAGDYKYRLEFQKNFPTLDSSRKKVDAWQLHCIRFARRPRTPVASPVLLTDANRSEITAVRFFVRKDSLTGQIDSNFQFVYGGKSYKIESATEGDDREEIEIFAKAREFDK